jgi:5-formyltetrahydrofolate cyclo-ligase
MVSDVKKRTLRKEMIQKRLALGPAEQAHLNETIQKHILESWDEDWEKVLMYINQPDEVETISTIKKMIQKGKTLCVPAYDPKKKIYFPSKLKEFDNDLEAGRFGILEPKERAWRPYDIEKLEVIFIPGLAFDSKGNRLGYGYGYFDEMCRSCSAVKIGLAYSFQLVEKLENHSKDVRLDRIITENGLIECHKK